MIRCHYNKRPGGRARAEKKNYYELLGVSVDSNAQKIKEAYRKLQKKYHPDIAGQKVISFQLFSYFSRSIVFYLIISLNKNCSVIL